MNKITFSLLLPIVVIAIGAGVGVAIVVRAQAPAIAYPIVALGNCSNEAACRVYCAESAHIVACTDFGEAHNLISKETATRARKFADVLRGEGPGGCKDEAACRAYCGDVTHLSACIAFAESHGVAGEAELSEMKRIDGALQAGATLPGGCKTKAQCEAYCGGGAHADECLAFAERAGTLPPEELAQAKKMVAFIKNKETPGGCASKDSCEAYCAVGGHFNECIAFAEKAGFITPEDLAIAKKTGGKGPGGCTSKDSCDAYCNMSEHADECLAFAETHDILAPEKIQEIKDGMGYLRTGLAQAPEEVRACLAERLGAEVIAKIEAGTLTPTQQIGESVKACFASQMEKVKDKLEQGLKMAPPEVMRCINEKVGTIDLQKIRAGDAPSPDKGEALRGCFEGMAREGAQKMKAAFAGLPPGAESCLVEKLGGEVVGKLKAGTAEMVPAMSEAMQTCVKRSMGDMETRLQQMPPQLQSCVRGKLGDTSALTEPPSDLPSVIEGCMKEFQPAEIQGKMPQLPEGMVAPQGTTGGASLPQFPPQAESCLRNSYGGDMFEKIKSGEASVPADISAKISQCMLQLMRSQGAPNGGSGYGMPPGGIPAFPSGY